MRSLVRGKQIAFRPTVTCHCPALTYPRLGLRGPFNSLSENHLYQIRSCGSISHLNQKSLSIRDLDGYDFQRATINVSQMSCAGLPIIHHYDYVSELPINHRFAMRKFHGVLKYLKLDHVISMKQVYQPEEVSVGTASLVHDPEYINKFFNGKTDSSEQRKTGFKWNEGLVRRCRLEAGGTILAANLAKECGLACSTAGGTHHAFPDHGSGYCLINDMAIAAKHALVSGAAERVLIVDLDVHQGDGTAKIFENDEHVFTFSMHSANNFPFTKQWSDLDIPLKDGLKDEEYMSILRHHLPLILRSFNPDLVIYDAGIDPHEKDELGKLNLTDQGLFDRDYYVMNECLKRGIPCTTVIGGGYSRDLEALSLRHTIVHWAASKLWQSRLAL